MYQTTQTQQTMKTPHYSRKSSIAGDKSPFLTSGQAARLLHLSVDTVRRMERSGRLSSWRTPGGQHRFSREDVIALVHDLRGCGGKSPEAIIGEVAMGSDFPGEIREMKDSIDP